MKKILMINLAGIGDFLLSTPSLRAMREAYPQSRITLLVSSRIEELARRMNVADEILVFDLDYGGVIPWRQLWKDLGILWHLRRERFDLAVNMRTLVSAKSAQKIRFLLRVIAPAKTAGRDTEGRGSFFDVRIPETDIGQKYEMEYDVETVEALGARVRDRTVALPVDGETRAFIDQMFERQEVPPFQRLIGIHPGGMPSRRWDLDRFARVISLLAQEEDTLFVLTGGSSEVALGKELRERTQAKIMDLCGQLNVMEAAAVIGKCDVFISNDTGPMHMAAALGTPLVAIFGPGDLTRFDPRHLSERVLVLRQPVDCAPCNLVICDRMDCLKKITPQDVVDAAKQLLEKDRNVQ